MLLPGAIGKQNDVVYETFTCHYMYLTYNESLNNYYISPINIKYLGTQFYTAMYNITFGIWYTLVISSPMFRHLGCFHLFYLMQDKQMFHVYNIYVWL